ncbi:MAG TPA: glycosyl hydrolase 115 family protein [Chitinophagaceae bacterium]|nr:glycosyl hydrolase 115 family protein [Chitinophagaceae bacterium]
MKTKLAGMALLMMVIIATKIHAQDFISTARGKDNFPVVSGRIAAAVCVDDSDYFLVRKAADMLRQDIGRVTGIKPELKHAFSGSGKNVIIIGSLDRSALIGQLIKNKKIQVGNLTGKWEAYTLQVVHHPFPGINNALVIAGSDRRGTAYGVFELSKQMGVSPWYWWADVPVKKKKDVFVRDGEYYFGPPAIKYRGIFINDEAPALSGWVHEKYGGFNHRFYDKVFELLLRLKANYLWPAMWGSAFNTDDTLNPVMASKYGIVMGTSHQEPMNRATEEWRRLHAGAWNYQTNDSTLRAYWTRGIVRMDHRETIVTIGMRGNGDKPMTEGSNISLLEKIVRDQRRIISRVTGKPASETPQDWALYKEVQDYYDKGMRVPDDVTLLFSDDNWGNIRRLPALRDSLRAGGYGIYYHFDYVGGPRNYKWLNTNPIPRVWEQMHLAYAYHVRRIWVVNVGDIKPMEFPISFFMDYAWDPAKWPASLLPAYTRDWAREQFGKKYAGQIADILNRYTQYNGRRKPELLSPATYSLTHYREAGRVVKEYNRIALQAKQIYQELPQGYKAAFYQLVLYPTAACANLNDLYVTAGKNNLYASQGRAMTNTLADSVGNMFARDAALSHYFNKGMENGRWDHMMDQTHIGYMGWQEPWKNNMPKLVRIQLPDKASMGVSVEGSGSWWPQDTTRATLPVFDPYLKPKEYLDIFNRGKIPFNFHIRVGAPWVRVSAENGKVDQQSRIWVNIDWPKAPHGSHSIPITISSSAGNPVIVLVRILNPVYPVPATWKGFVESQGYVSMEAAHFTRELGSPGVRWQLIPGLGRTLSAMTPMPVTAASQTPGGNCPQLDFRMYLFDTGNVRVSAYLSPTLDYNPKQGLRYALSIDQDPPVIMDMNADQSDRAWAQSVSNNIKILVSAFHIRKPGVHILRYWMVDPGVVLQKLVVDLGGVKSSYLGPPESFHR